MKKLNERNKWRKQRNGIINKDPRLKSVLYDLDLLPEQVKKGSRDEWKLDSVVMHWPTEYKLIQKISRIKNQ